MDKKTEKILKNLKSRKVGIFCDDSNLYHSFRKYGWRIDFVKLKSFLDKYCDIQFINYYIAIPEKSDADYQGAQAFLNHIKPIAVIKTKPLKYIQVGGAIVRKGDVDVELVLDVARVIDQLDVAIIMSGDSDYLELKNYVVMDKHKNILFLGYEENMAWELRQCWHIYVNRIRDIVGINAKNKPQV